ncbi:MAG TPA: hypothetical protein H9670_05575 [Firmicutes bacterium]|nr:hypothetical protein [Bacillota bacterium]
MRKLKVSLLLLFSMVLSLCLFACGPKDEEKSSAQIDSAEIYGTQTSISLTDTETADEATRMAAFNNAVKSIKVRVYYADNTAPVVITGEACDFDTSSVTWGTVGVYYATVTPKTQGNIVNDSKVTTSNQLEVRIDHQFGEPDANGESSCACGATQTTIKLEDGKYEGITVNGFHSAPVNDTSKGDLAQIKPFGTVASGETVNSMTAGTIRKGSSIVLEGTVKSIPAKDDDKVWYYPNLGIALREYDTSASPFNPGTSYTGGMSIIVRNDGWVLMNGIGESPRLLAGLVGSATEDYNYGSHTSATNTNTFPWDYDNGNMPADVNTWGDWAVYSSGTTATTGDYAETQNVRFTYSFRADNVIEIINENLTTGTSLVSRIKVPAGYQDLSFDTVLHGEYVEMTFNSITITEQQKLEAVRFNGLGSSAKINYVVGETLNLSDFDGASEVKYRNNDTWYSPDSYSVQVFRGELGDATAPAEDASGWTTITETTRLEAADKFFRIAVTVGNTTAYDTMTLGEDGFIKKITANNVTEAYGYAFKVTVPDVGTAMLDSTALGNIGFAANADASKVVIAPKGVASAIPPAYASMFDYDGYVALRVYGEGFATLSDVGNIKAHENYIIVASEADYFDILIGYTTGGNNTVEITEAQSTPIVIDLAGVTAPTYTSFISEISVNGEPYDSVPVNTGAQVTFSYTLATASVEDARFYPNAELATRNMWKITQLVGDSKPSASNFGYEYTAKLTDNGETSTFEITITVPAAPAPGDGVGAFTAYFYADSRMDELTVYYSAPIVNAEDKGVAIDLDNGYYAYLRADGTKLYYYVLLEKSNLTEGDIKLENFWLNINGGDAKTLANINLGFTYANGKLVMNEASDKLTAMLGVHGTTDDVYDIDYGFMFVGCIDATKCGVAADAETWYFQLMRDVKEDADSNVFSVTDGKIAQYDTSDATKDYAIQEASCDATGLVADVIKNSEDEIVFIYNSKYSTSHKWAEIESQHGAFKCEICGAVYTDVANGFKSGALAGASEKGLTISYAYTTTGTDDWSMQAVMTTTNNLIISGGTIDPWNVSTSGLDGELKTLAESVKSTNLYPSKATGSQVDGGASPFQDTRDGYMTIVVDPDETNGGIRYYVDGTLKIKYTNEHESTNDDDSTKKATVAQIVELFLALAEKSGVTLAAKGFDTANYAIVQVGVLDEDGIKTRYSNYQLEKDYYPTAHKWSTDTSSENYDHCTVSGCGILNPDHGTEKYPHVYVTDQSSKDFDKCIACGEIHPEHGKAEKGHPHIYEGVSCIICGAINPDHTSHTYVNGICSCGLKCGHENVKKVGDTCDICGGTLTETSKTYTADELANMNKGWGAGSVYYDLYKNTTLTFTAKFASNSNTADWSGFVSRFFVNGKPSEALFFQGNLFLLEGIKDNLFASAEGHTVNGEGALAPYNEDKTGFTWKLTVTWASDNAFTVKLEVWEKGADLNGAPSKTGTQYFTVSEDVKSMVLWIGPDSATVDSVSSVAQSYTYPAE